MIKGAVDAGADAIKFQKRTIDIVYSKKSLDLIEIVLGVILLDNKKKVLNLVLPNTMKLINTARS